MQKSTYQIMLLWCLTVLFKTSMLSAQPPSWIAPTGMPNNMSITAQIYLDGAEENGAGNILAAFVGNEVRGVATANIIGGKAYYFLTVHSNSFTGETVTFKVYLSSTEDVHPALEEVVFVKNKQLGNIPNGYAINVSAEDDFPISLLPFQSYTTLISYPYPGIPLDDYLVSQDNDPVVWTATNSSKLTASIGAGNMLTVTPNSPNWSGWDSIMVKATETGTPNSYADSAFIQFSAFYNYPSPNFDILPMQYVQGNLPAPSGDLNEHLTFTGPCLEYTYELFWPQGDTGMPGWETPNSNSGTMSLTVQVDFGGQTFDGPVNKLAGFVNGELAGVVTGQVTEGRLLYFLSLSNIGTGEITYRYYDAERAFLYEQASGIQFVPNGESGSAISPIVLDLAPIDIALLPNGEWSTTIVNPDWSQAMTVKFFATDCTYRDKVDSTEMVFSFDQCEEHTAYLPTVGDLDLLASPVVQDVTWYLNGSKLDEGNVITAAVAGVYHFEGFTPTGCPNIKGCPLLVTEDTSLPLAPGGPISLPGPWLTPPLCGPLSFTYTDLNCPPAVAACKNITIQLGADRTATITGANVDNGSFDACGTLALSVSPKTFGCADIGPNSVILTITDEDNMTDTCHASVTVADDIHPCCPSGAVMYVNKNTPNSNGGDGWENAYATLEEALVEVAGCPDVMDIWVAKGTYYPTSGINREKTFSLVNNVGIYGGFNGTETALYERDWTANPTILSGDIGTVGDSTDNSYHVVKNMGNNASAVLDGFTITGGNSNKLLTHTTGGGMLNDGASPTIRNCSFTKNNALSKGGGMYNDGASPTLLNCSFSGNGAANGGAISNEFGSSPVVDTCIFTANRATSNGGAVFNNASAPSFTGCQFMTNTAGGSGGATASIFSSAPSLTGCQLVGNSAGSFGGASYLAGASTPKLENCIVRGNSASLGGGLFCTSSSNATAINSTFHANSATHGGAVYSQSAMPVLKNCILWGDTASAEITGTATVTHSIVKGGHTGTGNLNVDPLFISATDLRTPPCSPAIDAGSNAAPTSLVDILGNARTMNNWGTSKVDMGAYELQADLTLPCTWTGGGGTNLWSGHLNWNDGFAPGKCRDVLVPAGNNVTVPTGYEALGKTLEVGLGAEVVTEPMGTMDIGN